MKSVHCLIFAVLTLSLFAQAKDIKVPGDCKTIQQAIDQANPGDVILISEGQYNEKLTVKKDSLTLEGIASSKVSIVTDTTKENIIKVEDVNDLQISGITFKSLRPKYNWLDEKSLNGAVDINNSTNVKIKDCKVLVLIAGFKLTDSQGEVDGCVFDRTIKGALIVSGEKSKVKVTNCNLINNAEGLSVRSGAKCTADKITSNRNKISCLSSGQNSELIINNSTFERDSTGLAAFEGGTSAVRNSTFLKSRLYGFHCKDKSSKLYAEKCKVLESSNYAMYATDNSHLFIRYCQIADKRNCIRIEGAAAEIFNSDITADGPVGIYVRKKSKVVNIVDNKIKGKHEYGIFAVDESQVNIMKNTLESPDTAILVGEYAKAYISDNIINSSATGIMITNDAVATIETNSIDSAKIGIFLKTYSSARITKNKLVNNKKAITTYSQNYILTDSNILENNEDLCLIPLNGYVLNSKFNLLENMASEFRNKKSKVDGTYYMVAFYDQLHKYWSFANDERNAKLEKSYDQWIKEKPQSAVALASKACMHIRRGWKARGTGFANTVSSEGWKVFREELNKAEELLIKADKLQPDSVGILCKLYKVSHQTGKSREEREAIFQRIVSIAPDCRQVYFTKAYYLMPRWHGSEGEMELFATSSSQYTKVLKADIIYALIAGYMFQRFSHLDFEKMGFDYDRIRDGYKAYHEVYPNDKRAFSLMARIASRHKDTKTISDSLKGIDDEYISDLWRSKTSFNILLKQAKAYREKQEK